MDYRLQYGSDFHLKADGPDFSTLLVPVAPDLALCGDIGDPFSDVYAAFLGWCSAQWRRVFVITGNHEYFTENPLIDMNETERHIRTVCAKAGPNIVFLQKEVYFIPEHGVAIMGTTMWSTPELRRWDMMSYKFIGAPGLRGEYNAIFKKDEYTGRRRPLHPSDITALSLNQTSWLRRTLNSTWGAVDGWRVIVLTHYLPTYRLNPESYKHHTLRSCYAVEMEDLFKKPVRAWVCGHSHTAQHIDYDSGCVVTLNPFGYKKEQGRNGYKPNAVVVV